MASLEYPFLHWTDDNGNIFTQALPPLDNIVTYGTSVMEAKEAARQALTGVLGAMLDQARTMAPPPHDDVPDGAWWIAPDPRVGWPVLLRLERERAGLTQGQLAERLGVTYQAVQKWERAGANPTLSTADRILRALGRHLILTH